ncbi:hypothetical protein N7471_012867, partial [Penicillium samsonianum]|uniref:uncharacterized protein n=1 Tax=Penicillium samsonianum TaxID=1882272 RepID=UPI002548FED5
RAGTANIPVYLFSFSSLSSLSPGQDSLLRFFLRLVPFSSGVTRSFRHSESLRALESLEPI